MHLLHPLQRSLAPRSDRVATNLAGKRSSFFPILAAIPLFAGFLPGALFAAPPTATPPFLQDFEAIASAAEPASHPPPLPAAHTADDPWHATDPKLGSPGTSGGRGGFVGSLMNDLNRRNPQVFIPTAAVQLCASIPEEAFRRILPGRTGGIALRGSGATAGIAHADGQVEISLALFAYEPAALEAHLFDPDGSEIYFDGGRPLLLWERPDDVSFAPVVFQGRPDPGSMLRQAAGDCSPRKDLLYTFPIREGQRLVLRIRGKALPSSFIKALSPAL